MVDYKITKRQKLLEQNNEMVHNYYYLIYGRIYNDEKTRYRKFRIVLWFDIFDLQEFFDKKFITNEDIQNYIDELIFSYVSYIKNYNDVDGLNEFYNLCNSSIENYNNR